MSASFEWKPALAAAASLLALAGCAQMPTGPTVTVMPGPNKPFEVFVADDRLCRDWALASSGGPNDAAAQSFAGATATGVVLGAAAGALVGGSSGAGVGAAFGGMTGAAAGSSQSGYTAYNAQRRYDIGYQQCMYAKGNQVPGQYAAGYRSAPAPVPAAAPRPPAGIQPPPVVR